MALNTVDTELLNTFSYHDMTSCHKEERLTSCHSHVVSCHDKGHDVLQRHSCHEQSTDKSYKQLSKEDWTYLVGVLETWRVFNPRSVVKRYGALNCWEAMIRTKDFSPRVPGAYFTKVVRQITGMNGKLQEVKKQQKETISAIEAFNDFKSARTYLLSITDADLKNPDVADNVEKIRRKWNLG